MNTQGKAKVLSSSKAILVPDDLLFRKRGKGNDASNYEIGGLLLKNPNSHMLYGIKSIRVEYMLRSNYKIYSALGCTAELAFSYTKMYWLAPFANESNLIDLKRLADKLSVFEIKQCFCASNFYKNACAAIREPFGKKKGNRPNEN